MGPSWQLRQKNANLSPMNPEITITQVPSSEEQVKHNTVEVHVKSNTEQAEDSLRVDKIERDCLNAWGLVRGTVIMKEQYNTDLIDELKPILSYKQYLLKKYKDLNAIARYLRKSNAEVVTEYDSLVEKFNTALPQIRENKDFEQLKRFDQELRTFVKRLAGSEGVEIVVAPPESVQ